MKISDIKPSITQMTDEEAFVLIKETRFQRRQVPVKKPRKTSTIRSKKPIDSKQVLGKMTKQQKLELLKELGGV